MLHIFPNQLKGQIQEQEELVLVQEDFAIQYLADSVVIHEGVRVKDIWRQIVIPHIDLLQKIFTSVLDEANLRDWTETFHDEYSHDEDFACTLKWSCVLERDDDNEYFDQYLLMMGSNKNIIKPSGAFGLGLTHLPFNVLKNCPITYSPLVEMYVEEDCETIVFVRTVPPTLMEVLAAILDVVCHYKSPAEQLNAIETLKRNFNPTRGEIFIYEPPIIGKSEEQSKEELQQKLKEALKAERYEDAAKYRDLLNELEK